MGREEYKDQAKEAAREKVNLKFNFKNIKRNSFHRVDKLRLLVGNVHFFFLHDFYRIGVKAMCFEARRKRLNGITF